MFCPQCGQERVSVETNYCSRCGFLLTAAADLLRTGGVSPIPVTQNALQGLSARRRGIRQGLFIFLLTFLAAPLVGMISMALRVPPFGVGIVTVLFFMGGLLRMVYALLLEPSEPGADTLERVSKLQASQDRSALPPIQSVPMSSYVSPPAGNWRDTNDLQPRSVVEGTTKLLERDD